MVTQIMVPVDGSDAAERALAHGQQLALATGAMLHVVRVVDVAVTWVPGASFAPAYALYGDHIKAEMAAATAYLEALHERLAEAGVRIRMERLTGYTAAALLDYECDMGIDLVIMCCHGRDGRARFAYGSVAARLLRHGVAPVLLVRPSGALPPLEQVAASSWAASASASPAEQPRECGDRRAAAAKAACHAAVLQAIRGAGIRIGRSSEGAP